MTFDKAVLQYQNTMKAVLLVAVVASLCFVLAASGHRHGGPTNEMNFIFSGMIPPRDNHHCDDHEEDEREFAEFVTLLTVNTFLKISFGLHLIHFPLVAFR